MFFEAWLESDSIITQLVFHFHDALSHAVIGAITRTCVSSWFAPNYANSRVELPLPAGITFGLSPHGQLERRLLSFAVRASMFRNLGDPILLDTESIFSMLRSRDFVPGSVISSQNLFTVSKLFVLFALRSRHCCPGTGSHHCSCRCFSIIFLSLQSVPPSLIYSAPPSSLYLRSPSTAPPLLSCRWFPVTALPALLPHQRSPAAAP